MEITKLFYDNSTYTKAGLATGGIYLQEKNINNESFKKKLNDLSTKDLSPILQARDIGQKLNQSLRQSSDFELTKNNTKNRKSSKTLNL